LPYDAVDWLVKKLDEQTGIMQMAEEIPMSAVSSTQQGVQMAGGPQGEMINPALLQS
jgi:hypothetical protein